MKTIAVLIAVFVSLAVFGGEAIAVTQAQALAMIQTAQNYKNDAVNDWDDANTAKGAAETLHTAVLVHYGMYLEGPNCPDTTVQNYIDAGDAKRTDGQANLTQATNNKTTGSGLLTSANAKYMQGHWNDAYADAEDAKDDFALSIGYSAEAIADYTNVNGGADDYYNLAEARIDALEAP